MANRPSQQRKLLTTDLNPMSTLRESLSVGTPWDSIVDFATHPSFCGKVLYPRQLTLLKLIFLETETMTSYDHNVIKEWIDGYKKRDPFGVPPDIMERIAYLKGRGYRWFPHVQMVMGRRGSKGICGGIIGAHQVAYFYSLDDWQKHFRLDENAEAYAVVVAVNQTQATRTLFNDLRGTVEKCQYLQKAIASPREDTLTLRTPADLRRIADMERRGIPIEREIASINALAASSNSSSIRGNNMFFAAFDEMAFMLTGTGGSRTSEELYHALQPSLDQFGKEQMIYVPSSPFTKVGLFYQLYQEGRAIALTPEGIREVTEADVEEDAEEAVSKIIADPHKFVFQGPSWALYKDYEKAHTLPIKKNSRTHFSFWDKPVTKSPEEDERVALMKLSNPEKFRVEREGQFAAVMDAYLREDMIEAMFKTPDWRDPLFPQKFGKVAYKYRIHCDPAKVNDNFAMAIAHLEDAPPDEMGNVWPHVIIDRLQVWKPEEFPNGIIDYTVVKEELSEWLTKFPSTEKMSFDQFNSLSMISDLQKSYSPRIRIFESTFTREANDRRFERFKSALYLGWIHSYADNYFEDGGSLLSEELKFLQTLPNGKVDHPSVGPVQSKDLADCVMVVATDLLHEHLERWQKALLGQISFGSTDVAGLRSATGREIDRLQALGMNAGGAAPGSNRAKLAQQFRDRSRSVRYNQSLGSTRGGRYR